MTSPILAFQFPENVRLAFTDGDCWKFALEGAKELLTIVTVSGTVSGHWFHAGVLLDNGNIMDVEGVWTPENWLKRWTADPNCPETDVFVGYWTVREFEDSVADNIDFEETFSISQRSERYFYEAYDQAVA